MDEWAGLTRDEWVETGIAGGLVLAAVLAAVVVSLITTRIVHRFTHSTEARFDHALNAGLRSPFVFIVAIWGISVAVSSLSYLDEDAAWLRRLSVVFTVIVVTMAVRRVLVLMVEWQADRPGTVSTRLHPGSLPLIRRGITILVTAVGGLIVLDTLGIEISPLLAGLGIGGLAVALALQPLLANVFASSYMLSDASIRIGDWIEITGGLMGTVDDIGWRATRIRTVDNNIAIVPNSRLADSTVTNYSLSSPESDVLVLLKVAYSSDLAQVEQVCREVVTTLRDEWPSTVKSHTPLVQFTGFEGATVQLLLRLRAQTWSDSFALRHELIKRVHARLAAEGIPAT